MVTWSEVKGVDVMSYEVGPRHAEVLVAELGLQNAKPLRSPIIKVEADTEGHKLDGPSIAKCKSLVARANYLAAGWPDIQFACKGPSHAMASPGVDDYEKLTRLGRYLKGRPRLLHQYWRETNNDTLVAYAGASWAGNRKTRMSTSGGVLSIGSHWVKSWNKSQSVVALSSAESELYTAVKTTAESLGARSMTQDLGMTLDVEVPADASAALGIIGCRGARKVRHLDARHLWIQEAAAKRAVEFQKVHGTENIADLMTKELGALKELGAIFQERRAELASLVATYEGYHSDAQSLAEKRKCGDEARHRPGAAAPATQGLVSAKLSDEKFENDTCDGWKHVDYFRFKRKESELKIIVGDEEFVMNKKPCEGKGQPAGNIKKLEGCGQNETNQVKEIVSLGGCLRMSSSARTSVTHHPDAGARELTYDILSWEAPELKSGSLAGYLGEFLPSIDKSDNCESPTDAWKAVRDFGQFLCPSHESNARGARSSSGRGDLEQCRVCGGQAVGRLS